VTDARRIVLLATTHRVPAGILSWSAWQTLHEADTVLVAAPDHPLLPALDSAGVVVTVVAPGGSVEPTVVLLRAGTAGTAVWVMSPDGDPGLVAALTTLLAGQASGTGAALPEVEMLPGSWDVPGARLLDVVAVMDRLRSSGGCPWDAAQTHRSLVEYLVEETYEVVEAIETGDDTDLREELGDLLLQVVFHARIAQERAEEPWGIDEVSAGIVDKLVSRHPHVFGPAASLEGVTPEDVEASWHALKAREKRRESVTDGIPPALPALVLAGKLLSRASKGDMAVPLAPQALSRARSLMTADLDEADLGEALLAVVELARERGWDAEVALRAAVRDHRAAIRAREGLPG
jgi:XTP/dITP diphosphohydrolase